MFSFDLVFFISYVDYVIFKSDIFIRMERGEEFCFDGLWGSEEGKEREVVRSKRLGVGECGTVGSG